MVSSNLKKQFEAIIQKGVTPLEKIGITPNHITILGVAVSILTAWIYMNWTQDKLYLIYAAITILFSGFLDAIDGVLARSTGQVTKFGGFFDSVSDRYSDAIVFSGIILGKLSNPIIGLTALIGSLMVSYTRSRAEAEGIPMAGIGLAERAERMILLTLSSITAYYWLPALNYGTLILAILAHATVLQRSLYFKKEIEKH